MELADFNVAARCATLLGRRLIAQALGG